MSGVFDGLPGFDHSDASVEQMYVLAAELGLGIDEIRPLGEIIGIMVLQMLAAASKDSTLTPRDPRFEVAVRPDNLSTSPVVRETAQTLESIKTGFRKAKS